MKREYYVIRNKALANMLGFLLKEDYYTFDDKFDKNKKIYTFKNTEKLKECLDDVNVLINKYK